MKTFSEELHESMHRHNLARLELLAANNPNHVYREEDGTPFVYAFTLFMAADALKILLEHGFPADDVYEDDTALSIACANNDVACAGLLLGHGADPNWQNTGGSTALIGAVAHCSKEAVALLLSRGANPDLVTRDGFEAIDFASGCDDRAIGDMVWEAKQAAKLANSRETA